MSEYQSLAVMSILFLFAFVPVSVGKLRTFGGRWLASNRNPVQGKEMERWAQRCERAHNNLKDNFPAYIAAVLLLGFTNRFDNTTQIACTLYVVARVGHYIAYGLGNVPSRFVFYVSGLGANTFLLVKMFL